MKQRTGVLVERITTGVEAVGDQWRAYAVLPDGTRINGKLWFDRAYAWAETGRLQAQAEGRVRYQNRLWKRK